MKDFDLEKLERQNIYKTPENLFKNIQERVLSEVEDFDLDKLERKNIYKVQDRLFETVQDRVVAGVKTFDIENLERKNIYAVPDGLFETVQNRVVAEVKANEKMPVIKLNWAYAAAASLALIFGSTWIYNVNSVSTDDLQNNDYAQNISVPKRESQVAYETLASDLTSVENSNQSSENQKDIAGNVRQVSVQPSAKSQSKTVKKAADSDMNEYLDSFTNSEIAELANNSSQDVYLDLYN